MSIDSIKIGKCLHIVQSITKLLQCSICLEVFSDPVSVGCAHFFCRNCISAVLRTQADATCPICKKSFTRRHVQEACQRQMIVTATKGLVSAIENIAGNKDSGKKKSKSPSSHSPAILLSSDLANHCAARNIKKAKFVTHKNSESVEITNETKPEMISYFIRKGGSPEEARTPKRSIEDGEDFKTKFYDRSESTPAYKGISKASTNDHSKGEEELKLPQNEKAIQSENSVLIDDRIVKRKPHNLDKEKKDSLQKGKKNDPEENDPYDFEESDNSVYNNGKADKSSCRKKTKRINQRSRQKLKRYIHSPVLSKKKRKIVCDNVEVNNSIKDDVAIKKGNKKSPDLLGDQKNDGSLMEENNLNVIQEIPGKCIDGMDSSICIKLRKIDEQSKGSKEEPVKKAFDSSTHVEDEQVLEILPSGDLKNDTCVQSMKSIGSLLSRTASLKSCQKLINNKKSLEHNNIKEDKVIDDSKDTEHPHAAESYNEDIISMETVVVLPATSPEDQNDDRDFMSRSRGWSRIKQMNKDFHLRKFSCLQVQKNKNLHSPNVSICEDSNASPVKDQRLNISEEPIPCESAEKKEIISSSRDQMTTNETSITSDIQYEKSSDPTSPHKNNALKRLNFDHQKIANDNEVFMDFNNTAPFDINDDMDVDAVFTDKSNTMNGEILVENEPLSPVVTSHSSLLVPEEPNFEFTVIDQLHNSSEVNDICKFKNDVQRNKPSCNFVLEKACISSDSGLKIKKRKKSAELLFTPEHSRQKDHNYLLKELLLIDESCEAENECASNNVIDRQQHPVLPIVDSGKETGNNERKSSSGVHNAFGEPKLNSFLSEKSFESSKSEKVIKRVCLTLDEIYAYFNDNNTSGVAQNIASVPLPFTNYKLQLAVAEETLNISILKVLQNASCENVNTNSNSSFQDMKPELSNTAVKNFKDEQTQSEAHSIDAQTQYDIPGIDAQTQYDMPGIDAHTHYQTLNIDAQTQCQTQSVDVETQCRTDSVDAQIQCSSLIVSRVIEEDSQMDLSMESLPETQPWIDPKKDDCEEWLNESIVTDSNIEMPILPQQTLKKIVCETDTGIHEKSGSKQFEKDSQVDGKNLTNETLYISSSSIPSLHSLDIKSVDCKSPLKIDICNEKSNSPSSSHSIKKNTGQPLVNNADCYPSENSEIHRSSTPIQKDGSIQEICSETNNGQISPVSKNPVKENSKSDANFTSSEALFEPTKFSNSKNTYSKAISLRNYEIELLKKEKLNKLKENTSPLGRLSPVESCPLSENFDPFAESMDFCKKSPVETEFDEILKESENYSSDPDMIFATNLVAPLKDIARKEKEIPPITESKHASSKILNAEKGRLDTDVLKSSQNGKQFKRISAYNDSDSSESEVLPQTRSLLKRRKRVKEKAFMSNVIKALEADAGSEENASLNLNNPQALAKVYANINADLNCGRSSPKPLDKPSVNEICDVKCVFEAPLSYNDDEPSETASKLELELIEMKEEAEKLRKQIFEEESMEKMSESGDVENANAQKFEVSNMSCGNEEQCNLSASKENNDPFSEQIPPTPPKVQVTEKRTKFSSKIYNRN